MPNLGKGTEIVKLLLSQASKDMHEPLIPMLFPSLAAHISGAEFQYPDRSWKEMCSKMANLVGDSGCNKGQLTDLTKAICRDFIQHDKAEIDKLREWKTQSTVIHRNASDGASECFQRPIPMLCNSRRNASLPPKEGIPMAHGEHRKGKSETTERNLNNHEYSIENNPQID